MNRKTARQWVAFASAVLMIVSPATAEVRTWRDASGKFNVDAEFVSAKEGKVRLRRADDKEITVALDRLSEDDQKFVNELISSDSAPVASSPKAAVQEVAEKFFADLRTETRDQAYALLTDAAQAIAESGKSPLADLPAPDDNTKAIKVGTVKIAGAKAEVPVQVRVGGKQQKTTLHLRNEADKWRVFALSAKVAGEEKDLSFETAPAAAIEKEEDPLLGLVGKELDLDGYTLDGKPLDMAQFKGKVVLIDFWATWCGPCRDEIPNILANWKQYHEAGFDVIAVSVDDDLGELRKFVAEEKPPWTVVADNHPKNHNKMGEKLRISGIPAFILLGKDGKVAAVHCRGDRLGQQLAQLLGDTSNATAQN